MITDICQRFTLGRESRRPAGEVIKPSAFDVVECVGSDADAVAFVEKHHYSGSCSARSHVFKLYQRGNLFPGHIGRIYQASNAVYTGKSNEQSIRMFPDGTVFSNVSSGKIRRKLVGWRYAASQLEAWGAPELAEDATRAQRIAWLEWWRGKLTVGVRHRGNHRYVFCLDPKRRDEFLPKYGPVRAYPKMHS